MQRTPTLDALLNDLREAVQRRHTHDVGSAQARADIDRIILEVFNRDFDFDRVYLAEIADVSPRTVRDIASKNGIPPRKPGGTGRRVTKPKPDTTNPHTPP